MKVARLALGLALVCIMAGAVLAQPEGGGQRGGRGRGMGFMGGMDMASMLDRYCAAVQKLDLTAEQKEKLEALNLKKEYGPKLKALAEKADKILTSEQKEARKAIREAKTQDERRAAYEKNRDKMQLTDDQRKQMEPIGQEGRKLMEEIRGKVGGILTDEQKTKLRESMPGPGGRRGNRRGGEESQRST